MKSAARFIFLLLVFAAAAPRAHAVEMLRNMNNERDYVVIVPQSASTSTPVLILYHDSEFSVERLKLQSRIEDYAENAGFIVVMPVIRGERWRDGLYGGARNIQNDLVFTDMILKQLMEDYGINPQRLYTAGMGAGGFMAQSYACYGKNKLAGMIIVGAALDKDLAAHCAIPPLDIVYAHGSDDKFFLRSGWMYKNAPYFSTEESVNFWIKYNGCRTRDVARIPAKDEKDKTIVTRSTFAGCKDGKQVTFFDINGGGHTWPGSYKREKPDYGRVTSAINMSGLITNMVGR